MFESERQDYHSRCNVLHCERAIVKEWDVFGLKENQKSLYKDSEK